MLMLFSCVVAQNIKQHSEEFFVARKKKLQERSLAWQSFFGCSKNSQFKLLAILINAFGVRKKNKNC
jgi:hypothetical protein